MKKLLFVEYEFWCFKLKIDNDNIITSALAMIRRETEKSESIC